MDLRDEDLKVEVAKMRLKASQLGVGWQRGIDWLRRRPEPAKPKVYKNSMAAMIERGTHPRRRGATLLPRRGV